MKLLFASDIHGDEKGAEDIVNTFKKENCDKLVLCGDLLYHGPRNDLPQNYAPKKVIDILNSVSEDIICVRGNCDGEVDQMVLDFPMMCDYNMIYADGSRIYVTHGHIYNKENCLKLKNNDVMVSGHTHILNAECDKGVYFINPGSASIPKENNPRTYAIYENKEFSIKSFDGKVIKNIKIG